MNLIGFEYFSNFYINLVVLSLMGINGKKKIFIYY